VKRTIVRLLIAGITAALVAASLVLLRDPDPAFRLDSWCALGRYERYDDLIGDVAAEHQLDPLLVKAIVWHESRFDFAKHADGARGLMQLGEGLGIEWAAGRGIETFMATDLFDPHTNLNAGCWYLSSAMANCRHRDAPVVFALAEYHAGREAVLRWAGAAASAADLLHAMDAPATRTFVTSVLQRRQRYAEQ
jgi:soluble lytic murein transglycosylase